MIIDDLVQGLQILRPHYSDDREPRMRAPEDELNLPPTTTVLDEAEVERLRSMSWYQPDVEDAFADGGPTYDPKLGWALNL